MALFVVCEGQKVTLQGQFVQIVAQPFNQRNRLGPLAPSEPPRGVQGTWRLNYNATGLQSAVLPISEANII